MTEITGKTALEVWKKALKFILEEGEDYLDKKRRAGKEHLNLKMTIENPETVNRPVEILNSLAKIVYPSFEEIKAVILGRKAIPGYYYHYGDRAFNPDWRNQVDDYVIPLIKNTPETKRAVVMFYNPKEDSFTEKKETPGLIMMNFNLRNDKLHVTSVIRSNDMLFGWPGNILQAKILQEYICKQVNCQPGSITTFSISAHFFEEEYEYIEKIINMKN